MKAWMQEKQAAKVEEAEEESGSEKAADDDSESDSSVEGEKLGDRLFKKKPKPEVDLASIKLELE